MTMNARLFLGLPIDMALANQLKSWLLAGNQAIRHRFRWTAFENYHVTMRFLGNVDLALVPQFVSALEEQMQSVNAFTMLLDRIDRFPNPRGRLIAVYVQASQVMRQIFELIESAVDQTKIAGKDKHSFLPHITVARPKKPAYLKPITPVILENKSVFVNELILYESQPTPQKSIYIPLHRFHLYTQPS